MCVAGAPAPRRLLTIAPERHCRFSEDEPTTDSSSLRMLGDNEVAARGSSLPFGPGGGPHPFVSVRI